MNSARTVALTGATGFLGLHLVTALAGEGARVRLLVRRDPTHELWRGLDIEPVPGSLEDRASLDRLVQGANAIVHVAGLIKARDRAEFMRTNRDGTLALAEATRRLAPAARFVAVSSLAARAPQLSDYAASKAAGEVAARTVYADASDRLVIVRPPAIYGPWDRETLAIFKAASGPVVPAFGRGRAAIVHVSDAAAAIAKLALGVGEAGCYALADTNPAGYAITELLAEAARAVGGRPRVVPVPDAVLSVAGYLSGVWGQLSGRPQIFTAGKVREMLHPDWSVAPDELLPGSVHQPQIGLAQGFAETAAWYKAAGWL